MKHDIDFDVASLCKISVYGILYRTDTGQFYDESIFYVGLLHWLRCQFQEHMLIAYIHVHLQSYCSNIKQLNAFVINFNNKTVFSNKVMVLRINASKSDVNVLGKTAACYITRRKWLIEKN